MRRGSSLYKKNTQLLIKTTKEVPDDPFQYLTFSDLEDWAGDTIVSRGKEYQRDGCVRNLCRIADGRLLATVEGTHPYTTMVSWEDGQLISECSCPYEDDCKHAVAAVLEYIARLKSGQAVPQASPNDRRMKWLDNLDIIDDESDSLDSGVNLQSAIPPRDLKSRLEKKTKAELIQLLMRAIAENPHIYENLPLEDAAPTAESVERLVKSIYKEIKQVSSSPAWWDSWHDEGELPDYSRVRKGLKKLLDGGHPDEVVKLGDFLFERSNEQVGQSNDDGETAIDISECLDIVFKALAQCSLSDADKLEKAIDFELDDQYDLCSGLESFREQSFPSSAWSELSDRLLTRLNQGEFQPNEDDFHERYYRDRLIDAIVDALYAAGRENEILPLCMAEADNTRNYPRVVRLLIETRRISEAEAWIKKGYAATQEKYSGIARELLEWLVKIKTEQKAWSELAAIRAGEFFDSPDLKTFLELESAARKAGCETAVRKAIQQFLEKGELPEKSSHSWPLPNPELPITFKKSTQKFPDSELLLEIAIHEKKPDEVLHWLEYDRHERQNSRFYYSENLYDKSAGFLSTDYPDVAISVWKNLADFHIRLTKPAAYRTAGGYLKKIQKFLNKSGQVSEWQSFLNTLRSEHKRKRRLMDVLDGLDSRPIIDTQLIK